MLSYTEKDVDLALVQTTSDWPGWWLLKAGVAVEAFLFYSYYICGVCACVCALACVQLYTCRGHILGLDSLLSLCAYWG